MNQGIRIAKRLVRLAKALVAGDYGFEKEVVEEMLDDKDNYLKESLRRDNWVIKGGRTDIKDSDGDVIGFWYNVVPGDDGTGDKTPVRLRRMERTLNRQYKNFDTRCEYQVRYFFRQKNSPADRLVGGNSNKYDQQNMTDFIAGVRIMPTATSFDEIIKTSKRRDAEMAARMARRGSRRWVM